MSERTEIVRTCDVCGKRVSDEGVNYHEMPLRQLDNAEHPFNGWFKLIRVDPSQSLWHLCSVPCLTRLAMERLSGPSRETLL